MAEFHHCFNPKTRLSTANQMRKNTTNTNIFKDFLEVGLATPQSPVIRNLSEISLLLLLASANTSKNIVFFCFFFFCFFLSKHEVTRKRLFLQSRTRSFN